MVGGGGGGGGTPQRDKYVGVCHCAWRDAAVSLGPSSHTQALKQWDIITMVIKSVAFLVSEG